MKEQEIQCRAFLVSKELVEFEGRDGKVHYFEQKFLVEGKEAENEVLTLRQVEDVIGGGKVPFGEFIAGVLTYEWRINAKNGTAKPRIVSFEKD